MYGGEGSIFVKPSMGMGQAVPSKSSIVASIQIRIPSGASAGLHQHKDHDEVYVVVSGSGSHIVEGVENVLHPGDIIFTSRSKKHTIISNNDDDLILQALLLK